MIAKMLSNGIAHFEWNTFGITDIRKKKIMLRMHQKILILPFRAK